MSIITLMQAARINFQHMTSTQCLGFTRKDKRCLKKVSNGEFCNYHLSQSLRSEKLHLLPLLKGKHNGVPSKNGIKVTSPKKTAFTQNSPEFENKGGFIYVYTLSSFLSRDKKGGWIQARNLINPAKNANKWVDLNINKLELILIKVGMTTKTPAVRIMQWQMKCNHDLTCLYPKSHKLGKNTFLDAFKRLTIKEKSYSTYDSSAYGFYVPKNIAAVEKQVHTLLKKEYGRGEIQCTGCIEKNESFEKPGCVGNLLAKTSKLTLFNVHNEWFPVPKQSIDEVFGMIDLVCKTQH